MNERKKQSGGEPTACHQLRHRPRHPMIGGGRFNRWNVRVLVHPLLLKSMSRLPRGRARALRQCHAPVVAGGNESSLSHLRGVALALLGGSPLDPLLKRMVFRLSIDPDLPPRLDRTGHRVPEIVDSTHMSYRVVLMKLVSFL